ncbi:glycosyltransferase family 2 protein [Microbacterium foliorum]|uniref:glycosyltransferase family 2 protein n=1 Tax=Microbacterium foliorum TaxID=104336 RepID=UPI001DC5A6D3|nr:glycosyltransferase family 2 protein [Microbacterium foliorum]CAH0144398.1 Putative glycosyltransferase EpsH [Microbacterium foliorum]CAH0145924.1 Putative glycosyltransferase EpsH [Microbacterium foliorum]
MRTPLVTVILPAKDAGAFIGTTLETLTRQFDDPAALKLVAVDDGSRDDTGILMRHYAERFPHSTVLVNTRPQGLASARNQGLAHVEGDAFCFLDGDDWMQPQRLSVLTRRLHELGCDVLRTDHVTVRDGVRTLATAPYAWRERVVSPRDAILPDDQPTMVDYPFAWAGILHRRVLDDGLAGFTPGLFTAEDRPWIWRLHLQARSFAVVDAPALLYRRGVSTSLTQVRDRRQLDFVRAMAEVIEIVTADREAERFLPKAVWSVLALSSRHLVRSRRMTPGLRAEMRTAVRGLLATLPDAEAATVLARLDGPRRRVLAPHLRAVGIAA